MNRFAAILLNILFVVLTAVVCGLVTYYACARWLRLLPPEAVIAAIGVTLSVVAVMTVFVFLRGGESKQ